MTSNHPQPFDPYLGVSASQSKWYEVNIKELQLKRALRDRIYYIIHGVIFMFITWFCTYVCIMTDFSPIFFIVIVSIMATVATIAGVYKSEKEIVEIVADLL